MSSFSPTYKDFIQPTLPLLLCLPQGRSHSPAVPYREHRDASSENSIHPSLLPKLSTALEKCVCTEISCYDKKKKNYRIFTCFSIPASSKNKSLAKFLFFSSIYFSHSVSLLFLSLPISSLKYYIPSLFFLCVFWYGNACDGQRPTSGAIPLEPFTSLSVAWGWMVLLYWMAKEPKGSVCLTPHSFTRITSMWDQSLLVYTASGLGEIPLLTRFSHQLSSWSLKEIILSVTS